MELGVFQISDDTIKYLRKRLTKWGREYFCCFPWRYETNQLHALIAEVLLQRTNAEQVVNTYLKFKESFPDFKALSIASIEEIEDIIAPLGLKWRAKFISELGKRLMEKDGNIPLDYSQLKNLPGVGPYAAAAYLSLHGGKRVPILDANIVRFYGRFFNFETGPETRRNKSVFELADRITPRINFRDFNYGLIDFTRLICRAKPKHERCPVSDRCTIYLGTI